MELEYMYEYIFAHIYSFFKKKHMKNKLVIKMTNSKGYEHEVEGIVLGVRSLC